MTLIAQLAQFEPKIIVIDGVQQSYRESGQGNDQVLVLLHGISSGSGCWLKQLQALGQHYHVIAWDAPGYGQSDPLSTAHPKASDYAQRLKRMLDVLGLDSIVLVGHSLGAMQAAAFKYLFPDAVERLLLANVAQGYKNANAETQRQVYEKRPKMLQDLGALGMAQLRGPHLVAQASLDILELIEAAMMKIQLPGFQHASYLLAYDAIQSYLTIQQQDVHVIKGMADTITPPGDIQALVDQYQLSPCYAIQQAGHLSYLDQAEQFNNIILSLKKIVA